MISDTRALHRKILNTYWVIFGISIMAELVALYFKVTTEPDRVRYYIIHAMLVPSVIQLLMLGINEAAYRFRVECKLLIIFSGTCIASALLIANQSIHLQYILLLPLMISMFYFHLRELYFAFAINIGTFGTLYWVFPQMREGLGRYELSAFIFIMIAMLFILRGIIQRGEELWNDLKRMMRTEQELLVKNAVMDRMVKIDALTDLYNHKTLHEYLDQLIEQSNNCMMPLQLAVIDIDDFKSVNDKFGHAVGDVILNRVACTLKESFSENEIIGRYGGEEFVVIFPGKTLGEAYRETERARENIWRVRHAEMNGRRISVSIGLAEYQEGRTRSDLFDQADTLLYAAKKNGKNRTMLQAI
ncbi:GGDEF domain-containing protein [Fontibacillus sp. BL9]|uniref:GGDEF domain-containing protein n=1 Tax=Fontibacillus sp. BL9 TaxID=3389971 RepID=UPI00397A9952